MEKQVYDPNNPNATKPNIWQEIKESLLSGARYVANLIMNWVLFMFKWFMLGLSGISLLLVFVVQYDKNGQLNFSRGSLVLAICLVIMSLVFFGVAQWGRDSLGEQAYRDHFYCDRVEYYAEVAPAKHQPVEILEANEKNKNNDSKTS